MSCAPLAASPGQPHVDHSDQSGRRPRRSNNGHLREPQPVVVPLGSLAVDLDAVRTFVAAAELGQFQEAAAALSITQQAVSKRVAALEKDLEVRLFTRTARGSR